MKRLLKNNNYIMILTFVSFFLVVRAFYSFDFLDESFYLAITDRFWKGASLIVDEWHPTQLFFPLLLPLYSFYRCFVPNGDGVFLFFRLIAILLAYLDAIFIFYKLQELVKKRNAFFAAALVMLYCRGNISGISYYNVYVMAIVTATVCFLCYNRRRQKKDLLIAGASLAIATCAMPYFVIADLLIGIVCIIRKKYRELGIILLGVLIVAVPYLLYMLCTVPGLRQVVENLPMLLTDEEHSIGWAKMVLSACRITLETLTPVGVLWLIASIIYISFRKSQTNIKVLIEVSTVLAIAISLYRIQYVDRPYVICAGLFVPVVLELLVFKREGFACTEGALVYVAGMLASICFVSGSNVNVDAISTGTVLSLLGVLIILDYYSEGNTILLRFMQLLCICMVMVCFGQRILCVANDANLRYQTERVECGPAKGLYLAPEKYNQYMAHMEMLQTLQSEFENRHAAYLTGVPSWIYVASKLECGSNSVWGRSVASERFDAYYAINKKDVPEIIVVGYNGNPVPEPGFDLERFAVGETIYAEYVDKGYQHLWFPYEDVFLLGSEKND